MDRNNVIERVNNPVKVALRKESVDRNKLNLPLQIRGPVALRKESVDRNVPAYVAMVPAEQSLSARRAWIEIMGLDGRFKL